MNGQILVCNLCDCSDHQVLFTEHGIDVVRCKKCGFVYSKVLSAVPLESKDQAESVFNKWERKKKVYSQIQRLSKERKGGNLIDVGCGTGNFLLSCRKEHFPLTIGVESSETRAWYASRKGIKVFNGRLVEAALPDKSFDVITYLETLEYISTPLTELKEANRILKESGIIVVEVPNLTFQLFKARFSRFFHLGHFGLMPEKHLAHFTARTIKEALVKAGFTHVQTKLRTHYLLEELPVLFQMFSILFYYFAKLMNLAFGLHVGSGIIAIAKKVA